MSEAQKFVCPFCPNKKVFPTQAAYKTHMRTHSEAPYKGVAPNANGVWKCPGQGCTYAQASGRLSFKKHYNRKCNPKSKGNADRQSAIPVPQTAVPTPQAEVSSTPIDPSLLSLDQSAWEMSSDLGRSWTCGNQSSLYYNGADGLYFRYRGRIASIAGLNHAGRFCGRSGYCR